MSVPSYSFHSLPLKSPNKGREEYSKIILFIPFHSLLPNKRMNGMIIREWKRMEKNEMIIREWNGMELSNLNWMF